MNAHPNPRSWETVRRKLEADGAPQPLLNVFRRQHAALADGQRGLIAEADIVPIHDLPALAALPDSGPTSAHRDRVALLKLNGGLGTSMGLQHAKSLIEVKPGLAFLDIIVRHVLHLRQSTGARLPLLLMNSFSTDSDTRAALSAHPDLEAGQPVPCSFLQHRVPRLATDTLEPIAWPRDPALEWCPPGHGNIYTALVTAGLLERLRDAGIRFLFVSNADNLGATLDWRILDFVAARRIPFLMEVTRRTPADRKGGHLAARRNGGLLLREAAQCPPDEADRFQDIETHRYFNTNNLWIDLDALESLLSTNDLAIDLPLIVNRKPVDPSSPDSPESFQLETAMGAAIACFENAAALDVPRTRFAPVKTTNDLLALWSDAYTLTDDFRMVGVPEREGNPPDVQLDPACYGRYDDFRARFPRGAPSLRRCRRFEVAGDFSFGADIVAEGDVRLSNPTPEQRRIPDGARLSASR